MEIRINKYLSEAGVCSRRQADRLIEAGEITLDGIVAELGDKVQEGQEVVYQGRIIRLNQEEVLLAMNKPIGIVCTAEKQELDNIVDFIHYPSRIYPIGRLDKDSSGLILLTNNGDLVNKIIRAGNAHEKEYIVTLNKDVTDEFVKNMSGGVPILDTMTRICEVEKVGTRKIRMILTQGLNRQIRRMCEYFDYRVVALRRTRIINIKLGDLKTGAYREIVGDELKELMERIKDSRSDPYRKEE